MFRFARRTYSSPVLALLLGSLAAQPETAPSPRIESIRFWSFGDVTRIAIQTQGDYTLLSDQLENPYRLYFDLAGLKPPPDKHRGLQTIPVGSVIVRQIRVAEVNSHTTRVVFDLQAPVEVVSSQLVNPDRLMIEIRPKSDLPGVSPSLTHSVTGSEHIGDLYADASSSSPITNAITGVAVQPALTPRTQNLSASKAPELSTLPHVDSPTPGLDAVIESTINQSHLPPPQAAAVSRPAPFEQAKNVPANLPALLSSSTASSTGRPMLAPSPAAPAKADINGDRSLVRVFGLKLGKVVIDAGHGGHDTGTIGHSGLMEKDLVLDVALRLGKLIERQLGAEVVYTRSADVFIPLEDRARIANEEKADLFISIHANSSPVVSATGVETYYFNFTSDTSGLDVATRENATSRSSISDLNDLLHKAVLNTKLEESRDFAQKVQTSLWPMSAKMNGHSRDRGVRRAPFVVLIGATMPSILTEVGFVSNPHDETLLKKSDQRDKIAEALFKGVNQYASSLSHVQVARAKSTD